MHLPVLIYSQIEVCWASILRARPPISWAGLSFTFSVTVANMEQHNEHAWRTTSSSVVASDAKATCNMSQPALATAVVERDEETLALWASQKTSWLSSALSFGGKGGRRGDAKSLLMLAAGLGWGRGIEILAGKPGERIWETDAPRLGSCGLWVPAAIEDMAREACLAGPGAAALQGLAGEADDDMVFGEAQAEPPPPPPGFYTALGFACLNGQEESAAALLLNLKLMDVDVERLPRRGLAVLDGVDGSWAEEALVFAVECGLPGMAKALLAGGACGESRAPAMRRAVELDAQEMVEALLSSGVDPNIEVGAELGEHSALSLAMGLGSDKALAMLLSRGADAGALLRRYGKDGEPTVFAETVAIRALREGKPAAALLAATAFSDEDLGRLAYWEAQRARNQDALQALESLEEGRYACSGEPEGVVAYPEKDPGAGSAIASWVGRSGVLSPVAQPSSGLFCAMGEEGSPDDVDKATSDLEDGFNFVGGDNADDDRQDDGEWGPDAPPKETDLGAAMKRLDAMEKKIDGLCVVMERLLALAEDQGRLPEASRVAELGATAARARLRVAAAAGVIRKGSRLAEGGDPHA